MQLKILLYKSWCSFWFLFLSLHLLLTDVCPITVNTMENAPRRGTASSALAMELITVVPLVITVSYPAVSKFQWSRKVSHVFWLRLKNNHSSFLVVKDAQASFERRCWLNHLLHYLPHDVFIQHCTAPCYTPKQFKSSWVHWANTFSAIAHEIQFKIETVNLP